MTTFKPTLIVKRLVLKKGQYIAYNEPFHVGLNVIRGANSSGKSTIMNFLLYGLGGDLHDWSEHALLCDYVWLEIEINGNAAVLRREIRDTSKSAMEVFGGTFDEAQNSPVDSWMRYPYMRTKNLESFSQALFRLMEMPDVANEISGNITMHQILRLVYADQLSSIDSIMRVESFDSKDLREAIGNLLCGAYTREVYENIIVRDRKLKEYNLVSSKLSSIITILHASNTSVSRDEFENKKIKLETQKNNLVAEIENAEREFYNNDESDNITLNLQRAAYSDVVKSQEELSQKQAEIHKVLFDIADSEEFIASLKKKIINLNDSHDIGKLFESVHFETCPSCSADVALEEIAACHLCKTPFDKERAKSRIVGLLNEAGIQLKQSELLQLNRKERLIVLNSEEAKIVENWRISAKSLDEISRTPSSSARVDLRKLQRSAGYIEHEIEEMNNKLSLIQNVEDMTVAKERLNTEISSLNLGIERLKLVQQQRASKSNKAIESEVISLLKDDLARQDSFENPESIQFSFRDNSISVDSKTYFSASSKVILKNSFLLGFLKAALKDDKFRHPRILLMDSTEDKGLEVARSHNFQRLMIEASLNSKVDHQIIYATSMPYEGVKESQFVGKYSTLENGTLNITAKTV